MADETKFKINLKTGEIEFEGSRDFVERQLTALPGLITLLKKEGLTMTTTGPGTPKTQITQVKRITNSMRPGGLKELPKKKPEPRGEISIDVPEDFSEWLDSFGHLSQTGSILTAGYFIQKNSFRNAFMTSEANAALKNHGIRLANAAASLIYLKKKKYVKTIKKAGKLSAYRLTPSGELVVYNLMK